ncbi:MAG TPA: hypothetical protein VGY57_14130, partial [Vicinamibacterales bacterium]|nr:hypothetical protein [Vicinamibacterales bacterium]
DRARGDARDAWSARVVANRLDKQRTDAPLMSQKRCDAFHQNRNPRERPSVHSSRDLSPTLPRASMVVRRAPATI